jgi:hypothetical protein
VEITSVKGHRENLEVFIDFKKLKLDQYRKLATLLGIKRSSSTCKTIDLACAAITAKVQEEDTHGKSLENIRTDMSNLALHLSKVANRITGLVFDMTFREQFAQVNDKATNRGYERGNGKKNERFYRDLTAKVNDDAANMFVLGCDDPLYKASYDIHLDGGSVFSGLEHPQGKLNEPADEDLVRLLVTNTGNHSNDPMSAAEKGVRSAGAVSLLTPLSAYYFFMHCECFPEVIGAFNESLPDGMLGTNPGSKKKPAKNRRASPTNQDAASSQIAASFAMLAEAMVAREEQEACEDGAIDILALEERVTNKVSQMEMYHRMNTTFGKAQIKVCEEEIVELQAEIAFQKQLKASTAAGAATAVASIYQTPGGLLDNRKRSSGIDSDDDSEDDLAPPKRHSRSML